MGPRAAVVVFALVESLAHAAPQLPKVVRVDPQPLGAQARRLVEAMDYLGVPFSAGDRKGLEGAMAEGDPAGAVAGIQRVLDPHCLLDVYINPESRVMVRQGPARPDLVEAGWRTFLVKVRNEAGVTTRLRVASPQAEPVWDRGHEFPEPPEGMSLAERPAQRITAADVRDRWLDLSLYEKPPLAPLLSGLELEYRILQLLSRDPGRREATIRVDVGQGTQDVGFRGEAPILFTALPATDVTLRVTDDRGRPATASFVIRDDQGRIYPSPAKRLAPDFAFHPQVYRADQERLKLPAGNFTVEFSRGPEHLTKVQTVRVEAGRPQTVSFGLERWIDPNRLGWYSGDHHVHAAGCRHYETPEQGVLPEHMARHIQGEALNVGSVLTWGPCYYYQKQFFEGKDHALSTAESLMHYDLEVSGFPSSHNGHLVLLGLKDQDYPGTREIQDWPTWNLPILRWATEQGAVTGYAHSGWGLEVKTDLIPNYEMPTFDMPFIGGIGANEYVMDVTHGAVDFISTVDTPAAWELNIWYHTLNSGFRARISGETDFPCIFGERVGLGRSYVQLEDGLRFDAWVEGVRAGRSYVSDGKSHLLDFRVNGLLVGTKGSQIDLRGPEKVRVTARVAARLAEQPDEAIRARPRTEAPYWDLERARIGATREVPVEVVVNGQAVASRKVLADGTLREVEFEVPVERSSWVALRILPSSHTNPVFLQVGGRPIRASRRSAEWCLRAVERCWSVKSPRISARERDAAHEAYEHARRVYRRIIEESPADEGPGSLGDAGRP